MGVAGGAFKRWAPGLGHLGTVLHPPTGVTTAADEPPVGMLAWSAPGVSFLATALLTRVSLGSTVSLRRFTSHPVERSQSKRLGSFAQLLFWLPLCLEKTTRLSVDRSHLTPQHSGSAHCVMPWLVAAHSS